MRKEDHQLILPYYEALLTKGVKYDTEGTGLGCKTLYTVPAEQEDAADHLQDEAPDILSAPLRVGEVAPMQILLDHSAERPRLRHAAVHAGERPDADLQHDGRAELRPCQHLHAGRLLRLSRSANGSASGRL